MRELKAEEERKADMEGERRQLKASVHPGLPQATLGEIRKGLKDLHGTLKYATPVEKKELLGDHIRTIMVPKTGPSPPGDRFRRAVEYGTLR